MKRCPNCQKEFPDSMRFCQTDGTSLVEVAAEQAPPPDPYKTVVGGMIKMDEDLLQIPEQDDPMKTMVSPGGAPKFDLPKSDVPPPPKPASESPFNAPLPQSSPQDAAPKFSEPSLSPPSFGDLSPSSSGNVSSGSASEPPRFDSPKSDPPASPFGSSPLSNEPSQSDSPFNKPSGGASSSPFDKPASAPSSSPFDKTPPPPYKDPEPMFGGQQPPSFGQSPFGQPQTPFSQSNEPANQSFQQDEWAPPPAPVAGWQDQGLGANTPFQPPVAAGAGGQNQTLAIVSLVCGVLSVLCCISIITGPAGLITGFLAKKNADTNPAEYGGRGMALAGMITGGIGTLIGIAAVILQLLGAFAGRF